MAWLSGWSRRKKVTVTGTTAGAQTDFQLMLDVAYDSDMLANFDDLRFTLADGTTLIDFWLESKVDSTSAVVWIEVPSIPANPDTIDIYMYYGKADAASASNGRNTYMVFDDFANGSSEQWTMANVTADRTTNHRLDIDGVTGSTSAYLDKGYDIGDYEFLFTYTRTGTAVSSGFGAGVGDTITNNFNTQNDGATHLDHLGSAGIQYKYLLVFDQATNYVSSLTAGASNTLYYGKLTRLGNVYTITVYSNAARTSEVWNISVTRAGLTNQRYVYGVVTFADYGIVTTGWMKDIRIRKYASPEPTYGTGSEEVPPEIRLITIKVTPIIEILPTIPYIRSLIRKDYGIGGWDRFNL